MNEADEGPHGKKLPTTLESPCPMNSRLLSISPDRMAMARATDMASSRPTSASTMAALPSDWMFPRVSGGTENFVITLSIMAIPASAPPRSTPCPVPEATT